MDGADHSGKCQESGSGFAFKSHYKKWYKKHTLLSWTMDFMLLNEFLPGTCLHQILTEDSRLNAMNHEFFAALNKKC